MSRQLIVNADDFGWSAGVNAAVAALYDAGLVTSTSLMVGCPAAAEAVELARERPGLAVGLHVTLAGAPALLGPAELPQLRDATGWLPRDWRRAALGYTLLPAWQRELRRELEAQFTRFAELGLGWSHVDTHLHTGLTPAIFRELLPACRRFGVAAVRIPEDDFELARSYAPQETGGQAHEAKVLQWLCTRQREALGRAGLRTTECCYGYFRSGKLDEGYLCRLIAALPEGVRELHCHPDLSTESGRAEFAALRSTAFRKALETHGVELTTYAALTGNSPERRSLRAKGSGAIQR
jgi:hopanoid biosynthesis associated protein HpnK